MALSLQEQTIITNESDGKRQRTEDLPVTTFETIEDVRSFIAADPVLIQLQQAAEEHMGDDPGHDLYHCQRVALWTIRLHPAVRAKNAIAAALLHDIVNVPKNHPRRHEASLMSAEKAQEMLSCYSTQDFTKEDIDDIFLAVRDHSFSRGAVPETALGKALQDADRLEALGVLGAFRNISCGTQMGAKFFDAQDPWARHRPLNDKKFSMDHYECKLLQLEKGMNTERGRAEARIRTERLHRLLKELGEEIGVPFTGFGPGGDSQ